MSNEIVKVIVTTKGGAIMCQTEVMENSVEHLELQERYPNDIYSWNI